MKTTQRPSDTRLADVLDAARHSQESSGLVYVPAMVRFMLLGGAYHATSAIAAIRSAAACGSLELRPESGLGRLSDADRSLCLTTTDYLTGGRIPLSWARLTA